MPMIATIRPAQIADAAAIAHVRVAAWQAAYRGLLPDAYLDRADLDQTEAAFLHDRLQRLGSRAWVSVAECNQQIVGYCAYGQTEDTDGAPASGQIYDLYIHPAAWSHGIGRQLLASALATLTTQRCVDATLFVLEANMPARGFYARLGWQPDGHREEYAWAGCALPVLRLRMTMGNDPPPETAPGTQMRNPTAM
jgi:ribosomal protein S18 acetylase RimI-like enzyme